MFELPLLPRTLSAAERDLAHPKERVRREAVRDLARWTEDVEERGRRIELLGRAIRDSALPVRRDGLLALADHADPRALPLVRPLLRETETEIRELAILVLGECARPGDVEVLDDLRPLVGASEARLRFQAVTAVVRLAPSERVSTLIDALADRDAEVRRLAFELVDEMWARRETPSELLVAMAERSADPAPRVRLWRELLGAERGLGWSSDEILRVVSGVERVVDGELLVRAIEATGRLRLEAARRSLLRRGFSWLSVGAYRVPARAALAALGEERAIAALRKELAHSSRARAGLALLALVRSDARAFLPEARALFEEFASSAPEMRAELEEFLEGSRVR